MYQKEKCQMSPDPVFHPEHYTSCDLEPIEVIKAWGLLPAFCKGNVIKYIARAGEKGDPVDGILDLQKARNYLTILIDHCEQAIDKEND